MKNKLIAALTFQFVVISVLTGFAIYVTEEVWLIVFGTLLLVSAYLVYALQRKKYEKDLESVNEMIESLITENQYVSVKETDDILKSKIQHQLIRLQSIMINYAETARKDKQEIRELIVEIAHQLRMPLANIQTYMDLLKQEELSEDERNQCIRAIEESESNLSFLIESFIKMSRLENKIIQIRKDDTSLLSTINRSIKQVKPAAKEKNIHIIINERDIDVDHDTNWLGEVIFNVLDNAVKYSSHDSEIQIDCIKNDMFTEIKVRDHGLGIDKGEENKVFQRFYRGNRVTSQEGFGIGLHISREIVMAHGGFMRVKRHDSGTSFSVFLPCSEK